ncbi:MAG: phosphatidate cytidylyltransferase [Burkholderiales bacterium]|nr:phosphatidate cytidylyltransferase [Burkholderiales bacterium]
MLKTRVITALVLLALIIPMLVWLPPAGWALFVGLFVVAGAWEWGRLAGLEGAGRVVYPALVAAIIGMLLAQDAAAGNLAAPLHLVAIALWLGLVPLWLARRVKLPSGWLSCAVGALFLVSCWIAVWQARALGALYLLLLLAVVWVADIAAYFAGRAFGRRKLAPTISPGKTWEGVIGGQAGVLVFAAACALIAGLAPNYFADALAVGGWALVLASAVVLAASSVVGDLFESLLKRERGLKDSSGLLPGHGGILDRIDALIPAMPLAMLIAAAAGMTRTS